MQWMALSQIKSQDAGRRLLAIQSLSRTHDVKAMLALIGALVDPVARVRVATVQAIGAFRDERCVKPLLSVLRDPEPRVREAAVISLKSIGHASAVPYLVPMLCDSVGSVRAHVAHALQFLGWIPDSELHQVHYFIAAGQYSKAAALGVSALEPLIAALSDESSSKRRAVTEALAEIDDPRATTAVAGMLEDNDPGVRLMALVVLGRTGNVAYSALVLKQLDHPDKNVRACALETLARIAYPGMFPILVGALKDPHWNVRAAAATALGRSSEPRALEPLLEALREADGDVRQVVAEAVGRLGDPRAIESLVLAQLDPDSRVRQSMSVALSQISPEWARSEEAQRTLPALKRALKADEYTIRQAAAGLLNQIFNIRQCEPALAAEVDAETRKRHRAVEMLATMLWDDDPLLRFAGVWALHQIGDPRAIAPLSAKLKDGDEFVRRAAERTLAQLGVLENARDLHGRAMNGSKDVWGNGPVV